MTVQILFAIITVNGQWSEWGEYSSCTTPCGTKTRTRTCIIPGLARLGSGCTGSSSETASCNNAACEGIIKLNYSKHKNRWLRLSKGFLLSLFFLLIYFLQGCCEDKLAAVGSCAKTEWCSSTSTRCTTTCQGSWTGLNCIFPTRCTSSREACEFCEGRWHIRKIFASFSM